MRYYEFLELFSTSEMYVCLRNKVKYILGIINMEKENEILVKFEWLRFI